MKIPAMIAAEFRRLTRTPMAVLTLLALGIIPLLYGGLYLWANQNPYDKLNEIPVALVVEDTGASVNGTETNFGNEVATELLDGKLLNWHKVTAEQAQTGVDDGKYDFSLTLPAEFSADIVSSTGDSPRQAEIIFTTNDANSYLGTTIGEQAVKEIKTAIVAKVNEQAASQFLDGLATIRTSLVQAVDGTQKLVAGATTAASGAAELASGNAQLASGSVTLRDGLNTLASATSDLPAETAELADGAAQVAAGDARIATVGNDVGTVSQDVVNRLPQARADIAQQLTASGVLTPAQINQVLATLDEFGARVTAGNARVQGVVGQLNELSRGSAEVASGARELANASPELASGIARAAAGSTTLATGAAQASAGATQLSNGLPEIVNGLSTLESGLQSGVTSIPETTPELRTAQAKNIAEPVAVKTAAVAQAGNYGAGLAPFFVALAAWIGIYSLFLIVKPASARAITALHSPIKITLAGWLTPAIIGALQMVALFFIVDRVLNLTVENPWPTYGIMALWAMMAAAVVLALNIWLGSVGQFIGLILMVVQLVTAGGTFPWQTLPGPLATVHHLLPMSYAVDGLRQFMYGGNMADAVTDVLVITSWLVVALIIAAIGVTRMTHFRTLRDLEPSLIE
ncbi:YhgE/Pip family protein [Leifsonia sp. A12D58]|uniref:YhgE/Pip family protein n=1 Tax=Leifsonia sp. A12D58 TaxID=3397674 RepID=UPI0039E00F12